MSETQTIALSIFLTIVVIGTGSFFLIRSNNMTPPAIPSNTQSQTDSSTSTNQENNNNSNTMTDNQTTDDQKDNGLIIKDDVVGTGTEVKTGDTVTINYTGKLLDGTVFDSSLNPGRSPFSTQIGVGQVIQGWDEGVVGMKVGGKRTLTIPPSLGYGAQATGSIPANSTLIFDLELLAVN
jgi:FKBP-type peptidyl-prolyl cis-trans isomerase